MRAALASAAAANLRDVAFDFAAYGAGFGCCRLHQLAHATEFLRPHVPPRMQPMLLSTRPVARVRCATDKPTGERTRRGRGDTKRDRAAARPREYALLGSDSPGTRVTTCIARP